MRPALQFLLERQEGADDQSPGFGIAATLRLHGRISRFLDEDFVEELFWRIIWIGHRAIIADVINEAIPVIDRPALGIAVEPRRGVPHAAFGNDVAQRNASLL